MKSLGLLMTMALSALAAPAGAQLVGGGIGGGLGGGVGGLGGSLGGGLSTTLNRPALDRSVADRATREVRARARAERQAARTRAVQGTATAADLAGRPASLTGTVSGSGTTGIGGASGAAGADARLVTEPTLRTRGAVAATTRGMRRVAATAAGVPVFVPQTAVAAPVAVRPPVAYYPAYSDAYYYGAYPVVIHETEVRTYMDGQQRDFERGLAGTGATVRRQGDDLIVAFPADVTFAFDKADIRPRFYGTLSAFARTLAAYPGTDIEIAGHTDAVGSDTYNLALSERRGRAVADFLAAARVEPARMVVEAFGETEPVASNTTVEGRAANRRVELIVHPRAR